MMSRKDTGQELDRPHYYSQFWIDVAQGKRDLSAIRSADSDAESEDVDIGVVGAEPDLVVDSATKPKVPKIPEKKVEPVRPPVISSLADLANIDLLMKSSAEMDSDEVPDIEAGTIDDLAPFSGEATTEVEPAIVTDFDLDEIEEEPQEEPLEESLADGEEFEEEEDDDWGSSRKPSKPQKPRRQPRERRPY